MRKHIVLIFAVFLVSHLFAQTECEVKLQKATLAFQNGEYVNCDPLFHDMIANCKWTPDEKKQIYKLYIATLFELDKITEGRETIYQFILAFPNYIPNATTDPVLFVENFDNFDSRPRLAIGFKAGGLHFTPLRTKINTPWADANYQLDYTGVKGINTLVVLDYYFTKNWILSSGLGVDWVTYTRDIPDNSGHHLNYSEEYFTVQIPATISYQRPIFRNVSLRLGLSAAVVKPVVALGSASFSDDNKVTSNQELVRDVDILNSRTPLILE
ncbi:MAG: hypothetical protein RIS47_825, partial [Bacteroidota bacterium]